MKLRDTWAANPLAARFLGNTGWILCERGLHLLLTLVTTSLTLRYLGPEGSGVIDYGASYLTVFTILCKLGIDSILVNEIVQKRGEPGELVGTAIGLRLVSALLSVGAIALLVSLLKPDSATVRTVTVIQAAALLPAAFDTLDLWFQSRLQSKYTAIAKLIAFVMVCGWRLALIWLKADVYWFAAASVVDAALIGVCLMLFYRHTGAARLRATLATARYLLPRSAPFILSALLITLYTQMDTLMLGSLIKTDPEGAVGIYNAAAKVCNMWAFVPLAIIDSARPLIMGRKGEDEGAYRRGLRRLFSAVIWLDCAAALAVTGLGKWIIAILAGEEFTAAVPVLTVLIWAKLFSLMGTTRGIYMVSENLSRYVVLFAGIGAAVNFILNFTLIPRMGVMGAAAATLATEVLTGAILPPCFKKTRPLAGLMARGLIGKDGAV